MILQKLIVALMVMAAAIYVARRYGPKWLTRKGSAWLAALMNMLGWRAAAETLSRESPAGKSCGSGCGSCGACGDDSTQHAAKPAVTKALITFHRR